MTTSPGVTRGCIEPEVTSVGDQPRKPQGSAIQSERLLAIEMISMLIVPAPERTVRCQVLPEGRPDFAAEADVLGRAALSVVVRALPGRGARPRRVSWSAFP